MHKEIFTQVQSELLDIVKIFKKDYYMVGGTAIALQIGHRYSLDFDLFTCKPIRRESIKKTLEKFSHFEQHLIWEDSTQMHLNIKGVKFTFFQYPYKITASEKLDDVISMPSLLDLAGMKALALGGRAKWKDYVDLYFILKNYYSFKQISDKAFELFGSGNFNPKLFKEQLSFFNDVNYSEEVSFLKGFQVSDATVKKYLIKVATEPF